MGNICSNQIFEEPIRRKVFKFRYTLETIPEEEEYETDSCYDKAPKKSNFSSQSMQTCQIDRKALQEIQRVSQAYTYF